MISAYPIAYAYALYRDSQERKAKTSTCQKSGIKSGNMSRNNNNTPFVKKNSQSFSDVSGNSSAASFDEILKVFHESGLDLPSIQFCKISTLDGWAPVFDVFDEIGRIGSNQSNHGSNYGTLESNKSGNNGVKMKFNLPSLNSFTSGSLNSGSKHASECQWEFGLLHKSMYDYKHRKVHNLSFVHIIGGYSWAWEVISFYDKPDLKEQHFLLCFLEVLKDDKVGGEASVKTCKSSDKFFSDNNNNKIDSQVDGENIQIQLNPAMVSQMNKMKEMKRNRNSSKSWNHTKLPKIKSPRSIPTSVHNFNNSYTQLSTTPNSTLQSNHSSKSASSTFTSSSTRYYDYSRFDHT